MSQSVSEVLISACSEHCRAGGQCDWQWQRQSHQEWFSELVTQLTIPDKLRNLNHDIRGWWLTIREWPGQHSQFLRYLTVFVFRSKINSTVNLWHLAQMFTIELCLGVRGALNTTIGGGSMDCHYVWRCWTQILGSGNLPFQESWDLGHSNLQVFTFVFVSWHAIGWRRSGLA